MILASRNIEKSKYDLYSFYFSKRADFSYINAFWNLILEYQEITGIKNNCMDQSLFLYDTLKYSFNIPVELKTGILLVTNEKKEQYYLIVHCWVEHENIVFDCSLPPTNDGQFQYFTNPNDVKLIIENKCLNMTFDEIVKDLISKKKHNKILLENEKCCSKNYEDLRNYVFKRIKLIYPDIKITH